MIAAASFCEISAVLAGQAISPGERHGLSAAPQFWWLIACHHDWEGAQPKVAGFCQNPVDGRTRGRQYSLVTKVGQFSRESLRLRRRTRLGRSFTSESRKG